MNIKKFIVYFIAISNFGLIFSTHTEQEIVISKETPIPNLIRYRAILPNNTKIMCRRQLSKKPVCELLKTGTTNSEEINWQNWYLLQELFEIQEKKAIGEVEKFEQELSQMKKTAKSESDFIENIKVKLLSALS